MNITMNKETEELQQNLKKHLIALIENDEIFICQADFSDCDTGEKQTIEITYRHYKN